MSNGIGIQKAAVLGSGTMGAQIALSLAAGGLDVALWGRRPEGIKDAEGRFAAALDFLIEVGLFPAAGRAATIGRLSTTTDLEPALAGADFVLEAIVEDLLTKQTLLQKVESHVSAATVLSSTTSAISATALQSALHHPQRFAIAHYAQPGHLVKLVEVVPGEQTAETTTQAIIHLLKHIGKSPVPCPDIPGFLWARIQHAILREFVSLVDQGLVTPEVCDTVLKEGYAVRLPAMGAFEHADLAGLDLIDSQPAREVWADLSNISSPAETSIGTLKKQGNLGMKSGQGFYDWRANDPETFKQQRDQEIVRRVLIQAGGRVVLE